MGYMRAHAFVQKLVARTDDNRQGAPLWYGWALREAFLAGIDHERAALKGEESGDG